MVLSLTAPLEGALFGMWIANLLENGLTGRSFKCKVCGQLFEPARRGGPAPKYCSEGCRRVGDRDWHRARYIPVEVGRQLAAEAAEGHWSADSGKDWEPSLWPGVDLQGGRKRPNARTAMRAAFEAELRSTGHEFTEDNVNAGLAPGEQREEYIPVPGGRPPHGGPFRHRDPGWYPVDEWLEAYEISRAIKYKDVAGKAMKQLTFPWFK